MQLEAPVPDWNVPVEQPEHVLSPKLEYFPAEQFEQMDTPTLATVPASHVKQLDDPV